MSAPIQPSSDLQKLNVRRPSLLTLIVLISFGSIGAALFTPAIPSIIKEFGISVSVAQLTVTLYLLGYCVGQLIYSPFAKRFGRKPALYVGVSIAMVSSFLCAISGPLHNFQLLLLGRLLTSLGSSVGLSLTFLIISDYFYEKHARKITAYTMLAFAVVPGISIAVGGSLVTLFGWESCFYFLTLYSIFALYLVHRLAETGPGQEKTATRLLTVLKNYQRDFKNPILVIYSILIGTSTIFVYIFAATAPVIVISMIGVRPDTFGLLNLIPACGYFLGNFVAARLANHFEIKAVLHAGICIMAVGVALLFGLLLSGSTSVFSIFLPVCLLYFGIPLMYSNAAVLATFRVKDKPNASSIMSFINIGSALFGIIVMGLIPGNRSIVMPCLFLFFFLFMLCLYVLSYKRLREDQEEAT
ncbi:MFS transporter [Simkania sp.]|uniref:MFS transporter n=1 Tax=Simkania sp. TaxID=34094 RepID=UPI003B520B0C